MSECEPSYMSVIGWMLSLFFFFFSIKCGILRKSTFSSKMSTLKDDIETDGVSAPLPSDAFKTLSIQTTVGV